MNTENHSEVASFIWSIADLLHHMHSLPKVCSLGICHTDNYSIF